MKDDIIDVQARTVLLDSEGNAVGDWYQDEEVPAVFLQFSFLNNTYENRIDVRIAHYRAKGSNKYAPSAENLFFRVYADQVRALKRWLIVEVKHPIHSTFGPSEPADGEFKPASPESPPAFTEVISNLTDESETATIPPFSQLYNMKFSQTLGSLLSDKRLWLVKLEMASEGEVSRDTRRHGVGLFAKLKDYGAKTATMRHIQRTFQSDDEFYFIAKGHDIDRVIDNWKSPPIELTSHTEIAKRLFPKHVDEPFLRDEDNPMPSEVEGYFRERCESVFRDVQEYNMVVGWGAILEQQVEAKVNGSGCMFLGKMQVYSVDRDDEHLAIIDLQPPDEADPDAPEAFADGDEIKSQISQTGARG